MLSLIITLAVIGLLVWLITTYIPMPDGFKKAIFVVAAICVVFYLLSAFGVLHHDIPVPQIDR